MRQPPGLRFFAQLVESTIVLIFFLGTLRFTTFRYTGLSGLTTIPLHFYTLLLAILFVAAWFACFQDLRSAERFQQEPFTFSLAMGRGILVLSCLLILILAALPPRVSIFHVLGYFWFWSTSLNLFCTTAILLLDNVILNRNQKVLILGTGPIARKAWREIRTRHFRIFDVVGFIDTECNSTALPEIRARYLGNTDQLSALLLRHAVDLIVIAMPVKSCYGVIQSTIDLAELVGIPSITFDHVFQQKSKTAYSSSPEYVFATYNTIHSDFSRFSKRAFDVLVSCALLLLLSPVLLSIALAIKLTSPGPALFRQQRYGYRRRKFSMFKFRTMVSNAEAMMVQLESLNEAVGPIFKMKADPRITPTGRFLRKTSLDELPQLWNVLIGEMSLVGPRPMSIRDVNLFSEAHLMRRFRVRPGITGLWQVSGRSNCSFDDWIRLDFSYIDRWSLALDLSILLKTIPAVLRGSGAM